MTRASDQAYRIIRDRILQGHLAPAEQLREEALAEECGVSRTPIREALQRLEREHLVRRSGGQRAYVADWSIDEIEEGFVLRAMLEGRAAERAASRIGAGGIALLQRCNDSVEALLAADVPDVEGFLEQNRIFHGLLIEASGSERLAVLLGSVVEQPVVARTARQYVGGELRRSLAEHRELVRAFECRDPRWARSLMVAHIRRAFHVYRQAWSALQPPVASP